MLKASENKVFSVVAWSLITQRSVDRLGSAARFHAVQIRWPNRSSASDSDYSYTFLRSVVRLSVVCLSHSCTLLKPFDGFRCHLAATFAGV